MCIRDRLPAGYIKVYDRNGKVLEGNSYSTTTDAPDVYKRQDVVYKKQDKPIVVVMEEDVSEDVYKRQAYVFSSHTASMTIKPCPVSIAIR